MHIAADTDKWNSSWQHMEIYLSFLVLGWQPPMSLTALPRLAVTLTCQKCPWDGYFSWAGSGKHSFPLRTREGLPQQQIVSQELSSCSLFLPKNRGGAQNRKKTTTPESKEIALARKVGQLRYTMCDVVFPINGVYMAGYCAERGYSLGLWVGWVHEEIQTQMQAYSRVNGWMSVAMGYELHVYRL